MIFKKNLHFPLLFSFFLLLWSLPPPPELYQQLPGFEPISQGKHNNNQSVGLMHSTSPAVNTNWFLKVLSFRRALLALVFVKRRRPPFEMAGHTKKTTCFRGKQRQRGSSQKLPRLDRGRLQLTYISFSGLCLIVQKEQGRDMSCWHISALRFLLFWRPCPGRWGFNGVNQFRLM